MILQSIAPEARSSATDYVADVTDVRKTEVRQCPVWPMPDALFGRCPMPCLADARCPMACLADARWPVWPMPDARCPMPDAPASKKKCGNSLPLPTAPVCRSFERRTLKITIALLLINVNTIKKIFQ